MILTKRMLLAMRTENGGFTAHHFEVFGFPKRNEKDKWKWCPEKGWKRQVIGKDYPIDKINEFRRLVIAYRGDLKTFDAEVDRLKTICF